MAYNLLKGKRGIIFGALDENSIAWKTALKVKEEGGSFTLTNAPIAMRMGQINELAKVVMPRSFLQTQHPNRTSPIYFQSQRRCWVANSISFFTPSE
jgi:enoyl-[acyl-carrier-protein] reductase (NADH)